MAHSPDVSGVAAGAWAPNDWDTPVVASKSVFIPSGLKNAASSLESSRVVQAGISSPQHEHAPVQNTGEKGRFSSPRILLGWDDTPPVAPVARIQVNPKGIVHRQLCWGADEKNAGVHMIIPGSPEVRAGSGEMVVLRDSVSPAHPGSKRKGGYLRQEMGAAIQEKQKGRLTHSKDPFLAAKREGRSFAKDDFVTDDRDLQADLLVQILPDRCLRKLLGLPWYSIDGTRGSAPTFQTQCKGPGKVWT